MKTAFAFAVVAGYAVRRGMPPTASAPAPGHTNNPGPAGATAFTVAWNPLTTDYMNNTYAGAYWVRVEYGTDDVTFPYWKYAEDGTLLTLTISSLASNTYYARVVYGYPSDQESNPSQSWSYISA